MTSHRPWPLRPFAIETPLGLFSLLWALATAVHTLEDQPMDGLPMYPLVILLMINPERIWAIASFAAGHLFLFWYQLPDAANHSMLAMLVDLTLLVGCAATWARRASPDAAREFWDCVRGPLMAVLGVVYFFAVFHKLNSSFFDPTVSCAVTQPMKMFRLHGFTNWPADPTQLRPNIYLTLVVETGIIALLFTRRFTHWGALLGLAFHIGLGWARFYDFATVAFALYLFFLPWNDLQARLTRIPAWAGFTVCGGIGLLAVCSILFYGIRENPVILKGTSWSFTADTLMCLGWTVAMVPLLLPIFRLPVTDFTSTRWAGHRVAWAFPLLAAFNGATSYLGLKTVANYSMFSNLRTEAGETNHLLIPAGALFVAAYQDDIVTVERYRRVFRRPPSFLSRWTGTWSPRWGDDLPGARVPLMEVRRIVQAWQPLGLRAASMTYTYKGIRVDASSVFADTLLMRPLSFVERKFMAFRPVSPDSTPSPCRW